MTFLDTDVIRVLDEVLPARFGTYWAPASAHSSRSAWWTFPYGNRTGPGAARVMELQAPSRPPQSVAKGALAGRTGRSFTCTSSDGTRWTEWVITQHG